MLKVGQGGGKLSVEPARDGVHAGGASGAGGPGAAAEAKQIRLDRPRAGLGRPRPATAGGLKPGFGSPAAAEQGYSATSLYICQFVFGYTDPAVLGKRFLLEQLRFEFQLNFKALRCISYQLIQII